MKTYRVGIIGLERRGSRMDPPIAGSPSFRSPITIAGACGASDRLEQVGSADVLPEKCVAFRNRWRLGGVYEDFREIIGQEAPDLVAVCTRAQPHAELGIAVAQLGVLMVCLEKAIACSMTKPIPGATPAWQTTPASTQECSGGSMTGPSGPATSLGAAPSGSRRRWCSTPAAVSRTAASTSPTR